MITASELLKLVDADRQDRGMSHVGYAAFLGISKTYWTRLRKGERLPSLNVLKALKARLPDLRPVIENYIVGLTEADAHTSASMAIRRRRGGIKEGGGR